MPLPGAVPVTLTAAERKTLKKRARGAKTPYRDRLRAQIVLAAACGRDNARIARGLGVAVDTVRKWRGRFAARRRVGLRLYLHRDRANRASQPDRPNPNRGAMNSRTNTSPALASRQNTSSTFGRRTCRSGRYRSSRRLREQHESHRDLEPRPHRHAPSSARCRLVMPTRQT